jgi:hypothetical protein
VVKEEIQAYHNDLNQIVRALVLESKKPKGPDWSIVSSQAQDLMALSSYALKQFNKANPSP